VPGTFHHSIAPSIKSTLVIVFFLLCFSFDGKAEDKSYFELTPILTAYYQSIVVLDWARADSLSTVSKKTDEKNALVYLFDNYATITRLLIQDKESEFDELKYLKDEHQKLIKRGDKESPYVRYARAEVLLQWSILNYKYGNRLEAFKDVWTAFRLLEENIALHPEFITSYRSMGLLHAFMGTLPISNSMKWLLERTSGMSGSIDQGLGEIEKVLRYAKLNPDYLFGEECKALYAYLILHLKNDAELAWTSIQTLDIAPEKSPMAAFVIANLALKTGQLKQCINYIDRIPTAKSDLLPFNHFLKARAELFLGRSSCRESFTRFLKTHNGQNYRYASYQKLAWSYLTKDDERGYTWWINQCLPEIDLEVGEDKDAHLEAKRQKIPDAFLLKARLLFDSGQYEQGLQILLAHDGLAQETENALEYHYRIGRIYQGLKRYDDAIKALDITHKLGANSHAYFACNAALQIGLIHEQRLEYPEAEYWFNECLNLEPDAYSKSLHHKAKTGLKRMDV
jgi:tetratricopeptide (TPR) repeat protein